MDCTAKYCNYWHKRKLPIDGNIIVDVSRLVGGRGGGVKDIIDGVEVAPPYSTINIG